MNRPIGARRASEADTAAIAALEQLAEAEVREQRGGVRLVEFDRSHRKSASQALLDPADAAGSFVFVGEIDAAVIGYATLSLAPTSDAPVAMVEQLFVHPEARRVGVGAALLDEARKVAEAAGASHFESEVLPGNRAAKNFFERMGMVTRKMRVSKPLD